MRYLLSYDEWLPWSIAFLPDGQTLAVGTFFGKLLLLNTQQPSTHRMLTLMDDLDNPIYSLAVSPDGQLLAAGGYEKLQIWDLESLTLVHTIEGFEDLVTSCAFLGDSRRLASGFEDGTIRIDDTDGATPTTTLDHHSDWVYELCISPDGTLLASGSRDRSAKLYDLVEPRGRRMPQHLSGRICGTSALFVTEWQPSRSGNSVWGGDMQNRESSAMKRVKEEETGLDPLLRVAPSATGAQER